MTEASRFFRSAQQFLPGLVELLLDNPTMVVLVPQNVALRNVLITKALVRAHVLRPCTEEDRLGGSGGSGLSGGSGAGSGGSGAGSGAGSGSNRRGSRRERSVRFSSAFALDDPFLAVRNMITLCGKAVTLHERRDPCTGFLTRSVHVSATLSRRTQNLGGGPFRESRSVSIIDDETCFSGTGDGARCFTALILERPLMGRGDVPRLDNGEPVFMRYRPAREWLRVFEKVKQRDAATRDVLARCAKLACRVAPVLAQAEGSAEEVRFAASDLHHSAWTLASRLGKDSKVFQVGGVVARRGSGSSRSGGGGGAAGTAGGDLLLEMLVEAVSSIIMFQSYPDTFSIYCAALNKSERVLMEELFSQRERGWRPRELPEELRGIKMHRAVDKCRGLNDARSPLAKLQCISGITKCIMEDVHAHTLDAVAEAAVGGAGAAGAGAAGRRPSPTPASGGVGVVIAADEMLPLFITVICDAVPAALLANTLYMRELASSELRDGEMGYALAMWEAAVAFIGRNVWEELELGDRDFGVVASLVAHTPQKGGDDNGGDAAAVGAGGGDDGTGGESGVSEGAAGGVVGDLGSGQEATLARGGGSTSDGERSNRPRSSSSPSALGMLFAAEVRASSSPDTVAKRKLEQGLISRVEYDTIIASSVLFRRLSDAELMIEDEEGDEGAEVESEAKGNGETTSSPPPRSPVGSQPKHAREHSLFVHAIARAKMEAGTISKEEYDSILGAHARHADAGVDQEVETGDGPPHAPGTPQVDPLGGLSLAAAK